MSFFERKKFNKERYELKMKKIFKIVSLLIIISLLFNGTSIIMAQDSTVEIHVSCNGSDENSGTVNSPVKTLERARNLYREKRAADNDFKGEIVVHGGVYRLSQSLELNNNDKGLTIRSYGDGEVLLRGSVALKRSSFENISNQEIINKIGENMAARVYQCNLDEFIEDDMTAYPEYMALHGGTGYYELFSGGIPQNIARWPNFGYAYTGNVSMDGKTFEVISDRIANWKDTKNGMLCGYFAHNWSFENIYIDDVDTDNMTVTLARNLQQGTGVLKGKRFFAMNMPEEIDVSGEYYIDYEDKMLYYYPDKFFYEEDPELSVLTESLITLKNTSDITLHGINFEYTRGMGISSVNSNNITIDSCKFRNIGSDAVNLYGLKNTVKNCEIYNVGSAGIRVTSGVNASRVPGESIVKNNNIYNFGRIFRTYQPGIFLAGFGNRAEFNTIHDAPHCAVRFTGSENVITHNEIYNVVLEGSDSSAIYCGRNWTYWENEISYNYFHDIKKLVDNDVYTASAIYMDDMLSGTKVSNNYFENCSRAIFFGGGKGNIISENTVVDCEEGIDYDDRAVTGNWGHGGVLPGGEPYDGFLKFLSESSLDVEIWKEKYQGFSELVEDVNNYQKEVENGKGDVTETGYPKNVTIKDNGFYGKNVTNSGYMFISEYAKEYGEVSNNIVSQSVPEINLPVTGADKRLWSVKLNVIEPKPDKIYYNGNIDFSWLHCSGADYYEISVLDYDGNEIIKDITNETGYKAQIEKKGEYNWTVKVVSGDKAISQTGKITVKNDSLKKGTFIAGNDFNEIDSLIQLKNMGWDYEVSSGDSLTLEKDANGNGYLRFERNENNLYNTSATFARLVFPEKTTGKITVTYDIFLDDFRGGWRDMGSLQTKSGSADIVRMLTHDRYFYGVKTSNPVSSRIAQDMTQLSSESYITIKRTVDLDTNTYDLWIYQDGKQFRVAKGYNCPDGDAGSVLFRLGYQNPYKPFEGEGNAVYRIDNVLVDMGELSPEFTYPENNAEKVNVNEKIRIKWNDKIKKETVDKESVTVYENGLEIPDENYEISADEKDIYIEFTSGMKLNSEYKIELKNTIKPDSLAHSDMTENYVFGFNTEKMFEFSVENEYNKNILEINSLMEGYQCIVSEYDDNNLKAVKIYDCSGDDVITVENKEKMTVYFWNNVRNMKPICVPYKN